MKVKVISIDSVLGAVSKGSVEGLEKLEVRGRVKNNQTTALLRPRRIVGRVQETRRDFLSLKLQ